MNFTICKIATENEYYNYQEVTENKPKISASGQTCGRNEKTGTFYPIKREECACNPYHENTRFREDLRDK